MKEKPKGTPTVSHVLHDGTIIELVLRQGRTELCLFKDGSFKYVANMEHGGAHFVPVSANNNLVKHGAVLLPSGPADFRSHDDLLQDLRSYIHRYVALSSEFLEVACAYVLLTWVYDAFNEICYLRFAGDFGSGKSRALAVIGSVCNKPFFASAASTISPVFYTLDIFRGTLILDEADFRFSDLQSDIVKIMNNGSTKGFPVLRQTQTETREFDPRAFHVYGPKIVGMRKTFDDVALESRFLTEDMNARNIRPDIPYNLPDVQRDEALLLRNKLLMYRFKTLSGTAIQADQVDRSRSGRFNQTLVPLLSVAPNEEIRATIRIFAELCEERSRSFRALSIEAEVVSTICELFAAEEDDIAVGLIASTLKARILGEFDRPVTPRYVGQILRRDLGLYTFKKHGTFVLPRMEQEKVERLAKRYGL
ncbi:MAG: hypothetical protein JWQ07_127 [Ramlibacter sp.]|nr:hypothetical protein [Ramlibacter sp.]